MSDVPLFVITFVSSNSKTYLTMIFTRITDGISISDDKGFGRYDRYIVFQILKDIKRNFDSCLIGEIYNPTPFRILYHPLHPMIMQIGGERIMFLSVSGNSLFEWAFQFSHELCHNLINGPMTGATEGLSWLEETICDISSIFHVKMLSHQYETSDAEYLHIISGVLQKAYRHAFDSPHPYDILLSIHREVLPLIGSNLLHHRDHKTSRDLYRMIARKALPLFEENPRLWKIILHLGDMAQWRSIDELFLHLHGKSAPDYSDSLIRLHALLSS